MDGVSAAASAIAIVQAGGMLLKVGMAFHETFISKANDHRAEDAALRVASIGEFLQKIELFQAVKLIPAPIVTGFIPAVVTGIGKGSSLTPPPKPGLDHILDQCKEQLQSLQKKVQRMAVPRDASKLKRFVGAVRLKMNEPEFVHIEASITTMLQQLTIFISLAQFQLSQNGQITSQVRHGELLKRYQEIEARVQDTSQDAMKQQAALLADLQKTMDDRQMQLDAQINAFEQSNQMILSSFEKLTISPRLDRSTSGLSGTTAATEREVIDEEDLIAPIAPGLMKHPGFGFRADRLSEPVVAKAVLDRVDEWLSQTDQSASLLCIHTTDGEDAMHDLCNRIVQDIAGSGARLLCYNGLPRQGPPPAPGWYTMTHAIWWLAGQLLIPVPHKDGHMPSHGYVPDVEVIIDRLENQTDTTTYVVLYLLTESCPTPIDRRLYEMLVDHLVNIQRTGSVRVLVFAEETDDIAVSRFPNNTFMVYQDQGNDTITLAEWEAKLEDDAHSHNGTENEEIMSETYLPI